MQKTVVSRLDEKLRMKWGEKSAKIERHSPNGTVLFQDFCQWLDEIATVSERCEYLYGTDYMAEVIDKNDNKTSNATPRPTGRGENIQASSRSPPRPSGQVLVDKQPTVPTAPYGA